MSGGWPGVTVATVAVLVLVVDNLQNLRLRDVITLGGLLATLATSTVVAVVSGEPGPLVGALVGAAGLFLLCFLAEFIRPGLFGFGTVEAAALVGAAAGGLGMTPWFGALLAFAVGCVFLVLVSRNREDVPTSPALAAGLLVSVVPLLVTA